MLAIQWYLREMNMCTAHCPYDRCATSRGASEERGKAIVQKSGRLLEGRETKDDTEKKAASERID